METLTIAKLLEIWPDSQLICGQATQTFANIKTDSRTDLHNQVFIALKGERFDGHDYLLPAIKRGAVAVVIDQSSKLDEKLQQTADNHHCSVVKVPNTWAAFYKFAAFCRSEFHRPVIAVTGSVGKTSSRCMISRSLKGQGNIVETEYNLNNEVGISQTLERLHGQEADYAIVEMGIDSIGEMARETALVQPDVAIITGIGFSHIDHFQNRQILLREKTSILNGLRPDGSLLLPFNDDLLIKYAEFHKLAAHLHLYLYGLESDFVPAKAAEFPADVTWVIGGQRTLAENAAGQLQQTFKVNIVHFQGDKQEISQTTSVTLATPAQHHAQNACLAIACNVALHLPIEPAASNLAEYKGANGRERILKIANTVLLDDSYNAASSSFKAVLDTAELLCRQYRLPKMVAVCGSINELGAYSESEHCKVGTYLAEHNLERIYFIGHGAYYMQAAYLTACEDKGRKAARCKTYRQREDLDEDLLRELQRDELIFFKGSHSFALGESVEKVWDELNYRVQNGKY